MTNTTNHMATIDTALRDGGKLHAFRSGGGLRVLRIEREKSLIGYGEHPHTSDAFRILAEDILGGGRAYGDVYGPIETHYLTGSSEPGDPVDAWVLRGNTFDVHAEGGVLVASLAGYEERKTPKDIADRATAGETVRWKDSRGVTFESRPIQFPNGDPGCSTAAIDVPSTVSKADVWMWAATYRASGATVLEALAAALASVTSEDASSAFSEVK